MAIKQIGAGDYFSVVLEDDGTVTVWGDNTYGVENVPPGVLFDSISVGPIWVLGVTTDGGLVAWGNDYNGEVNDVPTGVTNAVKVAAGAWHGLALLSDGTVLGWGGTSSHNQGVVPAGLTDVVDIAAGQNFSVAVKSDGTVVTWGTTVPAYFNGITSETNVVRAVAGGSKDVGLLKGDGTLVCYGDNFYSGNANDTNVVEFAVRDRRVIRLRGDGSIATTVLNSDQSVYDPPPAETAGALDVAIGVSHALVVGASGNLITYGNNTYGGWDVIPASLLPPPFGRVVDGGCGVGFTVLLGDSGQIAVWGDPTMAVVSQVPDIDNAVSIAVSDYMAMAVLSTGEVIWWGDDDYDSTIGIEGLPSDVVRVVTSGFSGESLALRANGEVATFGSDYAGVTTLKPAGLTGVVDIAVGGDLAVAVLDTGSAVIWGWDAEYPEESAYDLSLLPTTGVVGCACTGSVLSLLDDTGKVTTVGPGLTDSRDSYSKSGSNYHDIVKLSGTDYNLIMSRAGGQILIDGRMNTAVFTQLSAQAPQLLSGEIGVPTVLAGEYDHAIAVFDGGDVVVWGTDSGNGEVSVPVQYQRNDTSYEFTFGISGFPEHIDEVAVTMFTVKRGTSQVSDFSAVIGTLQVTGGVASGVLTTPATGFVNLNEVWFTLTAVSDGLSVDHRTIGPYKAYISGTASG